MITKKIFSLEGFDYKYDNNARLNKYTWFDTYLKEYVKGNAGDCFEVANKFIKGLHTHKDSKGKYSEGSDIEETKTSCKTWEFTLAKIKTDTFEENLKIYFENVASSNVDFGWIEENEIIIYNMNMEEFKEFLIKFARYESNRKVIRGPKHRVNKRKEIEQWLESRL